MQLTSSEPPLVSTIIRTGSDGRLRYSREQRRALLEAFHRSGQSAMAFSRQHGVRYQAFIAWVRKRRECDTPLRVDAPAIAEVMVREPDSKPFLSCRFQPAVPVDPPTFSIR